MAPLADALSLASDELEQVERLLHRQVDSEVQIFPEVGRYLLESGGKRVRPLLLILSAHASGYRGPRVVSLAAAVEYIHAATLLHDDVVDASPLRRGRPSANARWGARVSVLAGDFLFSRATTLMVEDGDLRILRVLDRTIREMAEGEMLELLQTSDPQMDESRYFAMATKKTGVLLSAACETGAILGESDPAGRAALASYGLHAGLAFQVRDDVLDYADEKDSGKARLTDLKERKMTLPLLLAIRKAPPEARDRILAALRAPDLSAEELRWIAERVVETDALNASLEQAWTLARRAAEDLAPLPPSPEKTALEGLAEYLVGRDH